MKIGENILFGVLGFVSVHLGKLFETIEITSMVESLVYGSIGAVAGVIVRQLFKRKNK